MKLNKMKYPAAIAASLAMVASSHAATVLNLTNDVLNSTVGSYGTVSTDTVSDSFAYNPNNPTVALPYQGGNSDISNGWHSAVGGGTLSYTLTGGAITTTVGNDTVYFDLYGRGGDSNFSILLRDNNYTVTLFNGDYSTQVAQLTGQSVADAAPFHNRSTFNLGTGVTFDRIQVSSSTDDFTVMEVRAATIIPEPSTALLGGLGMLALLRRRR